MILGVSKFRKLLSRFHIVSFPLKAVTNMLVFYLKGYYGIFKQVLQNFPSRALKFVMFLWHEISSLGADWLIGLYSDISIKY